MTKELKELDPLGLLEFLKAVKTPKDIKVNCQIGNIGSDWVEVKASVNEKNFYFWLPSDWYEQIGSVYFYESSVVAMKQLMFLVFERMPDYLENVYWNWVKNDTGYTISNEFIIELLEEIERIQEFLKLNIE
jgi:hypothetical protein